MAEISQTILTNLCMLYRGDGSFLVEMRKKNDWPGINFPGGHVERYESLEASCVREMKEETGLAVADLEFCGVYEWNVPAENVRHLALLYRSASFSGALVSSSEGDAFWIKRANLAHYPQATDFDKLLTIMRKGLAFI